MVIATELLPVGAWLRFRLLAASRWVSPPNFASLFRLLSGRVFAFRIAIFSFFLLLKLTSIKLESQEIL